MKPAKNSNIFVYQCELCGWASQDHEEYVTHILGCNPARAHETVNEIRIVDPVTGGAKGKKLARFDLIPVMPLTKLAEQYGRGAEKYGDRNYEKGYAWSLSYAAAQRHLTAFWGGEDWDEDWPEGVSHPHHLDAAIFHLMALREFSGKGLGTDDRAT